MALNNRVGVVIALYQLRYRACEVIDEDWGRTRVVSRVWQSLRAGLIPWDWDVGDCSTLSASHTLLTLAQLRIVSIREASLATRNTLNVAAYLLRRGHC